MSFISERYLSSWRYLRYSKLSPGLLAFIFCTVIVIMRNPVAVFRAEFWAEDATEFFVSSLSLGLKSLVTPVFGYHLFISRVIAYGATFFPVLWTPFIYAVSSLLIDAFVTSYFSRDGFVWIITSRPFRTFVCAILALGPGTSEVFLNLTNLSNVLTFFGLLLLIEKPFQLSTTKFSVLVVLLFSTGPMVILTPVVAFLWYRTRDKRYLLLLISFMLLVILNGIGNHYAAGDANLRDYSNIWLIPRILIEQFFIRLFFMPFLGDSITSAVMIRGWIFWPASFIVGVACFLYVFRKKTARDSDRFWVLFISFLCAIGSFAPIAISRKYAIGGIVRQSGQTLWDIRYSYLPGVLSLIIWFAVLFGFLESRRLELKTFLFWFLDRRRMDVGTLAVLGICLLTFHNLSQWDSPPYGYHRPDLHWPEAAAYIQKILDQKKEGSLREPAIIENIKWVHPAGWVPNHGKLEMIISPN